MEAVALASTFATLLGFAMQLYGNCKYYIDAAKGDCPNDLRIILTETLSLEATVKAIDALHDPGDDPKGGNANLNEEIRKTIKHCESCMKQLLELVPEPKKKGENEKLSKRDKAKIVLAALAWGTSGKKGKCEILLNHLRMHKATLNLELTTGLARDVKNIGADVSGVRTTVNTVEAKLDEAQRREVYAWLEKPTSYDPSVYHNNVGYLRESETGNWLDGAQEWKDWMDGSTNPRSQFLWVHGIAGAGKTVLAYTMIDKAQSRSEANKRLGLAYYYCHHSRGVDESVPFLKWTISQLCRTAGCIPGALKEAFNSGREPSVDKLLQWLEVILDRFTTAYVVVDAVDESKDRAKFLKVLTQLGSNQRFPKLRLAVTSRDYPDIQSALGKHSVSLPMANDGVQRDIRTYVAAQLQGEDYSTWSEDLVNRVLRELPVRARGMFRYAACQLEVLATCPSSKVVEKLNSLPKTLDETYERILLAIPEARRPNAILALSLILGSNLQTGPILAKTLWNAVAVGRADSTDSETEEKRLPKELSCLIRVRADKTVAVAHYTVREFLHVGRLAKHKKPVLRQFAISEKDADAVYCNIVMKKASNFKDNPSPHFMSEDENGDPTDFDLYALRRTRVAMFWSRDTLMSNRNKWLVVDLLNPYGAHFRGLKALGSDGPSDTANQEQLEWLVNFNEQATVTQGEKDAAHLTMLVSFENSKFVNEFLAERLKEKGKEEVHKQKMALFQTEMDVVFPTSWDTYRKTGRHDPNPKKVTVLGFYKEGLARGYKTKGKIDMLNKFFNTYVSEPKSAAAGPGTKQAQNSTQGSQKSKSTNPQNNSSSTGPSNNGRLNTANSNPAGNKQSSQTHNSSSKTPAPSSQAQSQGRSQGQGHNHGSTSHGSTNHPAINNQSQTRTQGGPVQGPGHGQAQGQGHRQSQSQTTNTNASASTKHQTPDAHGQSGITNTTSNRGGLNSNTPSSTHSASGKGAQSATGTGGHAGHAGHGASGATSATSTATPTATSTGGAGTQGRGGAGGGGASTSNAMR